MPNDLVVEMQEEEVVVVVLRLSLLHHVWKTKGWLVLQFELVDHRCRKALLALLLLCSDSSVSPESDAGLGLPEVLRELIEGFVAVVSACCL